MSTEPGIAGTAQDVILARVGAFVLDQLIAFALAALIPILLAVGFEVRPFILLVPIIYFGYFIVLEGRSGQTLGKRLLGVVVVDRDGSEITYSQSAVRNLFRIVDGFFSYALGLVVMMISRDRQRVGDHIAGTVVVRSNRPTGAFSPGSRW